MSPKNLLRESKVVLGSNEASTADGQAIEYLLRQRLKCMDIDILRPPIFERHWEAASLKNVCLYIYISVTCDGLRFLRSLKPPNSKYLTFLKTYSPGESVTRCRKSLGSNKVPMIERFQISAHLVATTFTVRFPTWYQGRWNDLFVTRDSDKPVCQLCVFNTLTKNAFIVNFTTASMITCK